ncbi:MAG: RNA polymerase subunit sigma-70 [Cytophagaceae bacterium SCN 52-12]|nr:MAG: RNA polymerase subunit sigma-70 [Cytophagaceae bacterium SCN 52-12]
MTNYPQHNDQALITLLKEGDEPAFAELHSRYKAVLFIHAYRMLGSEDEAKDVVQELFTTLWTRRSDIPAISSLGSYLYSAVRNKVLDCIARKKTEEKYMRSLALFMEEGENITEKEMREKELARLVEREISLLPERMREIFELSRYENRSYKEIAEELNISDKTVKKQVSNALIILRKKLDVALSAIFF